MAETKSRVYWRRRPPEMLEIGSSQCSYRVAGDPTVRALSISVDRKKQEGVLVLDGVEHRIPLAVWRIIQQFDID